MADIVIGGRLHSAATGNTIAGANEIMDDAQGKKQSVVNQETNERFNAYDTAILGRYTNEEINNLISNTPETDVIVVDIPAASQSDIAGWLDANTPSGTDPETGRSVRANKLYRVPGPNNTTYSEWAWNGTKYVMLANKDYGIDNRLIPGSNNVVKGGVIYEATAIADLPFVTKIGLDSNIPIEDFKAALLDFKLKVPREVGKEYGICKFNNGLPEGTDHAYAIMIIKWTKGDTPNINEHNYEIVDYIVSGTTFEDGIYEDNTCILWINFSKFTQVFGDWNLFSGITTSMVWNLDYIFDLNTGLIAQKHTYEYLKEYKGVYTETSNNIPYMDCVSEAYITDLPAGDVVLKYYDNKVYFYTKDSGIFARCEATQNKVVYTVQVYQTNNPTDYPIGKIVGYVVFDNIYKFKQTQTGEDYNFVNRGICENIYNSPQINEYLSSAPYLLKSSVFSGCLSRLEIGNFLKGIHMLVEKDPNYDYGIFKINNGYPSDKPYAYDIVVYKYPSGETPTNNNLIHVGSYHAPSSVEPKSGVIYVANVAKLLVDWKALSEPFGDELYFSGTGDGIRFDQEYIFGNDSDFADTEEIDNIQNSMYGILDNGDYLAKDSYFVTSDGITSAVMMKSFIKDFRMLIPKESEYQYGILHVNNGLPAGQPYSHSITVYKWPKEERPSSENIEQLGVYLGYDNPQNGEIIIGNNIAVVNVDWSVLTTQFGSTNYLTGIGDGVRYNQGYLFKTNTLESRVHNLETSKNSESIDIDVPDTIYAVVDDTLQMYYLSMFKCVNPLIYDINIICNIGAQFPRYFEVTPNNSNIGVHNLHIEIKDNNGSVLGSKDIILRVVSKPSQPQNSINILALGASCTMGGEWVSECARRLTENGGTPAGYGFSNIRFVGRINGMLEATGGYYFGSYLSTTTHLHKFYFNASSPAGSVVQGDVYTDGTYNYTVTEVNLSEGIGNISCTSSNDNYISGSGTLTKINGGGSQTLTYSNSGTTGNPFVYNGVIDIGAYANQYCNGKIDVVIFSDLFINATAAYQKDFSNLLYQMKTLINKFKEFNPNIKFIICNSWNPDPKGGCGTNYGAVGHYSLAYGMKVSSHNLLDALEKYILDNNLNNYCFISNYLNEFDIENDNQYINKPVNIRSQVTEVFGINGWHPAITGYYQLADSNFRIICSKILQ